MENILLIGKDPRLGYLKMLLDADGFPTNHISESPTDAETAAPRVKEEDISLRRAAAHAGSIIGPTPFSRLGEIVEPARLLPLLRPGQKLFGGSIPEQVQSQAEAAGAVVYDFMQMEEVALKNTIATADEAVSLSPLNIRDSRCLILGFGRCGKTLGETLLGLKARVTACDRNQERLALAQILGCACLQASPPAPILSSFDFIFNTIPAPVLDSSLLSRVKPGAVSIDIASAPGGTDFAACSRLGIPARLCPGLPGRYSPASSAKILYQAVISHL